MAIRESDGQQVGTPNNPSQPTDATTEQNNRRAPGDIDLLTCSLSNFDGSEINDLKLMLIEFSVYESIFSDHIRADLSFSDALALPTRMPIVGQESISLSFKTPLQNEGSTEDYDTLSYTLSVVEMKRSKWKNIRNGIFLMQGVSQHRITNMMTVLQKPYGPQPISNTVQQIIKETFGTDAEVDPTSGDAHFVMASHSPFQALQMLAEEAITADSTVSNFVFYEDHDGHKFKNIETLAKVEEADQTYYVTPQNISMKMRRSIELRNDTNRHAPDPATQKNPPEWYNVRALSMDTQFNIENAIVNGMYDNQVYWIDPLLQQYESTKCAEDDHFNYLQNFGSFQHIAYKEGQPLITEDAPFSKGAGQSHIRFLYGSPNQNYAEHGMTPRVRHQQLPYGISMMEQLGYIRGIMTVPGDTDRRPGHTIRFDLHELGATDDVIDELNEYLSGHYLVTSVRHIYTAGEGFYTVMEIVKNCYETKIENAPGGKKANDPGGNGFGSGTGLANILNTKKVG